MKHGYTVWLAGVATVLLGFVLASFFLQQSFGLAAVCDVTDSLLLASAAASFVPLALRSRGRVRVFWSLIILGLSMWLSYQLLWTYYEVVLHSEVPGLFAGDIVLFLDIVPLMAALALRPHAPADEYAAQLGRLDFALLLVWWCYLYVLIVIPWQYVEANIGTYNRNLYALYFAEKVVFLLGTATCWVGSKGHWRRLYAGLFGMSLTYCASSTLANWAISRNSYYSGSLYDVPLSCAMAWLTWIGLRSQAETPESEPRETSTVYGVWVARCSMIAVFSLPLFAAWTMTDTQVPSRIRVFRLTLTLLAAFSMGVLVLARQRMLERQLVRLLGHSQESFDNLKRLQTQILQSEKMASIGQLVGGAAHELNNPITAMLGYSDLLLNTELTAEQQPLAAKIGQYVRRTKSLVASLLSFARQSPAPKTLLDLNTLARTAVKLAHAPSAGLVSKVRCEFDPALPKVLGDSNQLLQVCQQLLANCWHVLSERDSRIVTVRTDSRGGYCVLQMSIDANADTPPSDSHPSSPIDPEDSLGMSACQAILQEHQGRVSRERREDGSLVFRMELPAVETAPKTAKEATVPVLWQSRPYA